MKLNHHSNIRIAKCKILNANSELESLDYQKWQNFVDNHKNYFIWNEDTAEGKITLKKINDFSERIRNKILATLNKGICFSKFNKVTNLYDISTTFYEDLNWITIQFACTPSPEDLKIYLEMANHLNALLLKDGTEIIDDKVIDQLSK